jgi:hypothetical protein
MRYRLIPTRGRSQSEYAWGGSEVHAYNAAEVAYARTKVPVLIVEAPEGGIVRQVGIVGQDAKKARRR